jgi:hypothetical protein
VVIPLTIIKEEVMQSSSNNRQEQELRPVRKPWEAPAIVLERPLETQAQRVPPQSSPDMAPVVGPFGTSGGTGTCL